MGADMNTVPITESTDQMLSSIRTFRKTVWFDHQMDHLIYLDQDCNYRADRVDEQLTLLFHPYESDLVGVKLKGIGAMYESIFDASARPDEEFVAFVDLIGGLMIWRLAGTDYLEKLSDERRELWQAKYQTARRFVEAKRKAKAPRNLDEITLNAV